MLAVASVNGDGSVNSNTGFSSIVRVTDGQYDLTLEAVPPPDFRVVPVAMIHDATTWGGVIATVLAGVITVRTFDATGISTDTTSDAAFYILVSTAEGEPPAPSLGDGFADASIGGD